MTIDSAIVLSLTFLVPLNAKPEVISSLWVVHQFSKVPD
jgi:hypothetical protein